jgi:serine/threonine protein kinase
MGFVNHNDKKMKNIALPDLSLLGYQIDRELGRNREGGRITWQARQLTTNKTVVIKQFCFATANSSWSGYRAYQQEIELLQKLQHAGIPRYLDSLETNDGFCLVQEYIPASSLAMARSFTLEEIVLIASKLLEILVYLQQQQQPIFHRDLKPENILVDAELNTYLIDFGLARLGLGEASASSIFAGTPGFMPPEQIIEPTKASDLYSLGVTIICLLIGKNSIEIQNLIAPENPYKLQFKSLLPPLNRQFVAWLNKMVQPQVNKRFPDAETALKTLQSIDLQPQNSLVLWQQKFHTLSHLPNWTLIIGTGAVVILSSFSIFGINLAANNFALTTTNMAISIIGVIVATLSQLTAAKVVRDEPQARNGAIALALSVPILLVILVALILGRSGIIAMTTAIVIAQLLSLIYTMMQPQKMD